MDLVPHSVLVHRATEHVLFTGDRIGREAQCELSVQHRAVHGQHSHLSLRDGRLHLVGRPFVVDNQERGDVELVAGQVLHLAHDCFVEVRHVHNPPRLWRLHLQGAFVVPLQRPNWSIVADQGQPRVGLRTDAVVRVALARGAWHLLWPDDSTERVEPGVSYTAGSRTLSFDVVDAIDASASYTDAQLPPLRIECQVGATFIRVRGRPDYVLQGVPHDLFRAVARMLREDGAPPRFERVGHEVWGSRTEYRSVYYAAMRRLSEDLVEHDLPGNLLQSTGRGTVTLGLRPIDAVEVVPASR